MYPFSLLRLAIYFATVPAVVRADPESTASPNATVTFDPVTLFPSIIYQDGVAGQRQVAVTHSSYVTASSTTEAVAYETGTMPLAAWQVDTGSIAYNLPLLASLPIDVKREADDLPAVAFCWYPVSVSALG